MRFEEGQLCFEFGSSWEWIEKYDQSSAYRQGISKLQGELKGIPVGTKGVDLVGLRDGSLYLVEINDFRGHPIETKASLNGEVWLEIGLKIRDTLAGLIGAHSKDDEVVGFPFAPKLLQKGKLTVISWMEVDRARADARDWQVWSSTQRKCLKQKLTWLDARCDVVNQNVGQIPDLKVTNLPRK